MMHAVWANANSLIAAAVKAHARFKTKKAMPFSPLAPAVFFDDDDIAGLITVLSERLRRDQRVRPVMDKLVGNHWYEAEQEIGAFLAASVFLSSRPRIDAEWLAAAMEVLAPEDVDALADIMLSAALSAFPLQSAAVVAEICDRLAEMARWVLAGKGARRQQRSLKMHERIVAGALMNGL
jgi:hypothetical protein